MNIISGTSKLLIIFLRQRVMQRKQRFSVYLNRIPSVYIPWTLTCLELISLTEALLLVQSAQILFPEYSHFQDNFLPDRFCGDGKPFTVVTAVNVRGLYVCAYSPVRRELFHCKLIQAYIVWDLFDI